MKLYHIVAVANNRVIGKDNQLPWPKLSEDLKHFKATTLGSTVIMGRKTFKSIGKPLPNRDNFILTRNPTAQILYSGLTDEELKKVRFLSSLEDIFKQVQTPKGFIIGGAEIFKQTFDLIEGIYMTRVYENYPGDTFYPDLPDFFEPASSKLLPAPPEGPRLEVVYYENTHKVKPDTAIGKME